VKVVVSLALAIIVTCSAHAQAQKPGNYYVMVSVLEERIAPSSTARITNRIYVRQKVEVLEIKGEWARVSKYYDGSIEGASGQVARWVLASGLSPTLPPQAAQPKVANDPRISKDAIPKVGEGGLTTKDVEILYKGAIKFLDSGKCSRVEFGDKSTSKADTYYVNCGGPNLFFTSADL
jgi:hypothetical protein